MSVGLCRERLMALQQRRSSFFQEGLLEPSIIAYRDLSEPLISGAKRICTYAVVTPDSEAKVAPAAPAGTHQVRSPTIPSIKTLRSDW
jgi:hypothetical protein